MLKTVQHHAKRAFPALTHRNFQLFFAGQLVSVIGTWMQLTAEQWLVYPVLTQSKILLGLVGVLANLPVTLLVLLAGVYIDRTDRRKVLIITQSLFAFYALILSILVWSGKINIPLVLLFALLGGITFAFDMPARQAFFAEIVDKKVLPSAISLNSGAWNTARMIAPPVAGILIATVGIAICYFLNAISYLAVILSLLKIKVKTTVLSVNQSAFSRFKEGIAYVLNNKNIFWYLFALAIFSVFSFSFTNLLPVFTHDIFHADEKIFGLLGGAVGLGAMLGAFSFSFFYNLFGQKVKMFAVLVVVNFISLIIFAFSKNLFLSFLALIVAGYTTSSFISGVNTVVQLLVRDDIRGRVMSFYSLVFVGAMPFGSLYAGTMAHFFGAPLTVFLGVLISLVTLLYIYSKLTLAYDLKSPSIFQLAGTFKPTKKIGAEKSRNLLEKHYERT